MRDRAALPLRTAAARLRTGYPQRTNVAGRGNAPACCCLHGILVAWALGLVVLAVMAPNTREGSRLRESEEQ
jgi:hypothetical protein